MSYPRFSYDGVSLYARTGQAAFVGRHGVVSFEREGSTFTAHHWAPGQGDTSFSGTALDVAAWVNKKARTS